MNLLEYLNIKTNDVSPNKTQLLLHVSENHKQPFGLVHGGLYGVLIETACSLGANANLDPHSSYAVGIDLQVNHLSSVTQGTLITTAVPDKIGDTIQVWQAEIQTSEGKKIAVGRCTLITRFFSPNNQ